MNEEIPSGSKSWKKKSTQTSRLLHLISIERRVEEPSLSHTYAHSHRCFWLTKPVCVHRKTVSNSKIHPFISTTSNQQSLSISLNPERKKKNRNSLFFLQPEGSSMGQVLDKFHGTFFLFISLFYCCCYYLSLTKSFICLVFVPVFLSSEASWKQDFSYCSSSCFSVTFSCVRKK